MEDTMVKLKSRLWVSLERLLTGSLFILLLSPALVSAAPPSPADLVLHGPVLEDSFAFSSIQGGPWLIFLEGSDAGGDMRYFWFEVTQLGGRSSTEIVYLRGQNRRSFSGHVAIYFPAPFVGWKTVRAEIRIKDTDGNYSAKRVHEVKVGMPTRETLPDKWRPALGNRLGNIYFDFEVDRDDIFGPGWRD